MSEERIKEYIKENYVSRLKIKSIRLKLIDSLKANDKEIKKTAIKYAIKILNEILEDKKEGEKVC